MGLKKYFTRRDIYLLLSIAILSVLVFAGRAFLSMKQGSTITITVDGKTYGRYHLDEDQTVPIIIDGVEENTISISNGVAFMSEATCPDRLCIRQGAISRSGQSIVCLPHRVIVSVEDDEKSDIDSIAR